MIKQQTYSPSEVLISIKEPYDKNTLWIHPFKGYTEIKVYNEGWKLLFSTKDLGLSNVSLKQVKTFDQDTKDFLIDLLKKQIGNLSNSILLLTNKNIELERRLSKLENQWKDTQMNQD